MVRDESMIKCRWIISMLIICAGTACNKVPLEDDFGQIDFASAHWFENEKVGYLFFSLAEKEARLVNPGWFWQYSSRNAAGQITSHEARVLDLESGVHKHEWRRCGSQRLCGSLSFKSDDPIENITLRFRYDASLPQGLEKQISASNHLTSVAADAFSALAYGVFDETNDHLQVRVHSNFGDPSDEAVDQYGMTRRFRIKELALADFTKANITTVAEESQTPLLFPASLCQSVTGVGDLSFTGRSAWFKESLDANQGQNGACFQIESLDKNGDLLALGKQPALSRRNPELNNPSSPMLTTPAKAVTQLPVIIRICDDEPSAGSMINANFFNYQQYVLGMQSRPVDICFRVGQETQFGRDLATLLSSQLNAAKTSVAGANDFIFVVLLHHNFSSEFKLVQATIARSLYQLINNDQTAVSPRLVGAFVYDSNVNFQPTSIQSKNIIWCPQTLPKELVAGANPLATQNCTLTPTSKINLQVINFIIPLGPLPSQEQYLKYVNDYGDSGIAKNPAIEFLSVPNGANTRTNTDSQTTYFDGERYSIAQGEYAKVCRDRVTADFFNFVLREENGGAEIAAVATDAVNAKWLSDEAAADYRIGISWAAPYFGVVRYKSAVINGQVPGVKGSESILPFNRSFSQNLPLGDGTWQKENWSFGAYTQKCGRFCDNPYFDNAGTYQLNTTWRSDLVNCPSPRYPSWNGGGAG